MVGPATRKRDGGDGAPIAFRSPPKSEPTLPAILAELLLVAARALVGVVVVRRAGRAGCPARGAPDPPYAPDRRPRAAAILPQWRSMPRSNANPSTLGRQIVPNGQCTPDVERGSIECRALIQLPLRDAPFAGVRHSGLFVADSPALPGTEFADPLLRAERHPALGPEDA